MKNKKKTAIIEVVIGIVAAILLFGYSIITREKANEWGEKAVKTEAVVTDVEKKLSSNSKNGNRDYYYYLYLSFETDGMEYTSAIQSDTKYEKGDTLTIYYNSYDPREIQFEVSDGKEGFMDLYTIIGFVLLAVSLYNIYKIVKKKKSIDKS